MSNEWAIVEIVLDLVRCHRFIPVEKATRNPVTAIINIRAAKGIFFLCHPAFLAINVFASAAVCLSRELFEATFRVVVILLTLPRVIIPCRALFYMIVVPVASISLLIVVNLVYTFGFFQEFTRCFLTLRKTRLFRV